MSLASTTQAVKRLQSTLEELKTTLASTPVGSNQFSQIAQQIGLATAALERYQKLQSEFASSMRASQVAARQQAQDPGYIPHPVSPVGGPKFANVSGASVGQDAQMYVNSLANVRKSLQDVGVSGKATEEILGRLDAQIRALPDVPTGMKFTGGGVGKSVTPTAFLLDEVDPVKITGLEKYNKLTGESATQLNAKAEAAKKAAQALKEANSEEQRLLNLQTGARNDPTLAPVLARAQQAGFGVGSLKNIRTEGNTGVRMLEFQQIDPSGVVQKYNASISKLGDVLPEVGRKFRTFGQSVIRDVGELTKWSIAMAVIYGPIQKLSEITTLMIQNEVKLAEATIAVNDEFSSSEKIFNAAALAANNAGEEINTTIAAFTAAYRATGGGVASAERFTVAQKLLADSMTLAKLAGIDESAAIDSLSAALRQQGMSLSAGSTLLDKWVKTTQVANVDLNTLATGFAVMGETADAAGISVDKLNGIIATIAETGLASGKEAANSARRVITAFETPGAVKELQRLGIATEDATGKARSFLDIGQQIYEMRQKTGKDNTPLISDEAFSNLTLIAGQGVRGQAALSALLGNWQRIAEVERESKNAPGGEAANALEKQLATAQTAITRFGNAWQEFAQTLGTKGGLLDLFKGLTNSGTSLVNILNGITGALGKATPMVTAMTVAMIAFYRKPAETRAQYGMSLNNSLNNMFPGVGYGAGKIGPAEATYGNGLIGPATQFQNGSRTANFLSSSGVSGGLLGKVGFGAGAGLATSLIPAAMNAASGDTTKALADIGGGIAGGIVGNMLLPGAGGLIGSTIGTSMAEMFIALTDRKIQGWLSGKPGEVTPGVPVNETPAERDARLGAEGKQKELDVLNKRISDSLNPLQKLQTNPEGYSAFRDRLQAAIEKSGTTPEDIDKLFKEQLHTDRTGEVQRTLAALNITPATAKSLLPTATTQAGTLPTITTEQLFSLISPDKEAVARREALINSSPELAGVNLTGKLVTSATKGTTDILNKSISDSIIELSKQFTSGKLKSTAYSEQLGRAQGAVSGAPYVQTALGLEGNDPKKIKEIVDVLSQGSAEAATYITNLATAIDDLLSGKDKTGTPEQLKSQQEALKKALLDEALNVKLNQAPIRGIVGDVNQPMTSEELRLVTQRAQGLQKGYYSSAAGGNMTESDMKAYIKRTFEPAAVPIKDAADLFYKVIEGIDPQFFKDAMDQLAKEGKLTSQDKAGGIDFQVFKDVDRSTLENLAKQSVAIGADWTRRWNYGGKAEDQIAIAKDGVAKPLHADFKILSMLLEKLVDQGQKQLDGMFNMPDGANFWVNLAAAQMHMETANASSLANLLKGLYTGTGEGTVTPPETKVGNYSKGFKTPSYSDYPTKNEELAKYGFKTPPYSDYPKASKFTGITPTTMPDRATRDEDSYRKLPLGTSAINTQQSLATTLNLNIRQNSTIATTLTLDGKTIATIILPFIKSFFSTDMVKATSAAGNTTKDYIV